MDRAGQVSTQSWGSRGIQAAVLGAARPLHALVVAPAMLFLLMLAAMLFHSADVPFYELDRIAFLLLLFVVGLRMLAQRDSQQFTGPVTWPMLGLLLLAGFSLLRHSYDTESWSVFAAKWLVPFMLFELAGSVFSDAAALRKFETFAIVALAYLSLIAVFFLFDFKSLIFPRYILDESLGIHADRARGPFLQAVANGVSLNLLALIALDSFRRRRLPGTVALGLMVLVPLAALATKTRAVWLSFSGSVLVLLFSCYPRVRRTCLVLAVAGGVGLVTMAFLGTQDDTMAERLQERGPVDFRVAVYRAGWGMLLEKPLLGWGAEAMQSELTRRISDFHQEAFYFHNTYLEIVVEHGLLGLALYVWLVIDLFRLGRKRQPHVPSAEGTFLDEGFRSIWPVMLGVYLLHASFVVMNYQFVNGLLFTVAGVLAAQNRRAQPQFHASAI
jgi:O-antigen ligase